MHRSLVHRQETEKKRQHRDNKISSRTRGVDQYDRQNLNENQRENNRTRQKQIKKQDGDENTYDTTQIESQEQKRQYESPDKNQRKATEALANELLDACEGRGEAVKKKEDTHRMAEANRAFSHFRF